MESRLLLSKDEVRLKAYHIFEEASEFVKLGSDDDIGSRVLLKEGLVRSDCLLELLGLLLEFVELASKFEDFKEVLLVRECLHVLDVCFNPLDEGVHVRQGALGEIFWRWLVLLDTL